MRISAGNAASFDASFLLPNQTPAVLVSDPTLTFFRNGVQIWEDEEVVITDQGSGTWSAVVIVPSDSLPGWVEAKWQVEATTGAVEGSEMFEVYVGTVSTTQAESNLRRRLRDALPDGSDDSSAFFLNDEIHSLLAINGGSIVGAAYDGWAIRAAHYQTLVDVEESGSSRRLSQMFKNAEAMMKFYEKALESETGVNSSAIAGRVVGVVASLRGEYVDALGLATVGFITTDAMYVRPFPLKRLLTGIY